MWGLCVWQTFNSKVVASHVKIQANGRLKVSVLLISARSASQSCVDPCVAGASKMISEMVLHKRIRKPGIRVGRLVLLAFRRRVRLRVSPHRSLMQETAFGSETMAGLGNSSVASSLWSLPQRFQ